jgi:ubiquinone/menaquinone biosynthesis C-methylase UbiE
MHAFFRVARRTSLFGNHINLNISGSRVLDIGCGTGIWSIELAPYVPHIHASTMPRDRLCSLQIANL